MPITLSMKMSPKQAGKMYQELNSSKERINELEELLMKFKEHFQSVKPVFSRESAVAWINTALEKT